ncbi:hypothetical protein F5B18DRAFT_64502 [Nemania serpens]|nr:hypothetical protein F5B18DRAFT_64502 [Nemania serpens]
MAISHGSFPTRTVCYPIIMLSSACTLRSLLEHHDYFLKGRWDRANNPASTQTGEGGPAPDENDEGTDEVTGEVDAPHSREPKTVVKTAHKKGTTSVAPPTQRTDVNDQDNERDEAHDEVQGPDSNVDELEPESNRFAKLKRGRPARIADMSARQGNGQSSVTQQGSNGGEQGSAPRRRGRPSKNSSVPGGTSESAASLPMTKTAQDKQKRAAGDSLRRSSRVAAESATQQIAVQSVRFSTILEGRQATNIGALKGTYQGRSNAVHVVHPRTEEGCCHFQQQRQAHTRQDRRQDTHQDTHQGTHQARV